MMSQSRTGPVPADRDATAPGSHRKDATSWAIRSAIDEDRLPVFQRQDWAIAASGKRLRVLTVERGGVVVGRILHDIERLRLFFRVASNPPWCAYGGIVLSQQLPDHEKLEVAKELLSKLPRYSALFQSPCHVADAPIIRQALEEAGFIVTGSKTRILHRGQYGIYVKGVSDKLLSEAGLNPDDPSDVARSEKKFSGDARTQIRKAHKELDVVSLSPAEFVGVYKVNLNGRASWHSFSALQSLLQHGLKTGSVSIFAARKKSDEHQATEPEIQAAIACAFDRERYYVWRVTARKHAMVNGEKPHPHAMKLLLVGAMIDARKRGLVFDTEGGDPGLTDTLYPRLGITGEEYRIVARRLSWPHAIAKQAHRLIKQA